SLEVTAAVVLLDYTLYVWHVLAHKVPVLWRFHAVHHADRHLAASTAPRFHFVEMVLSVPWRAAQVRCSVAGPPSLSAARTTPRAAVRAGSGRLALLAGRIPWRAGRGVCSSVRSDVLATAMTNGARTTAARFEGFADREGRFFRALARNRRREWFAEHRREYEEGWLTPMKALLGEVRERIDRLFPHHPLGAPKVFRIHRD